MKMDEEDFPALCKSADSASLKAQSDYFNALKLYLFLLILAAFLSFAYPSDVYAAMGTASLFLVTLGILIWLKVQKPEDIWYNGRAVAESVKTRTWRWIMKAEPYDNHVSEEQAKRDFLNDLKAILDQNRSLSHFLAWTPNLGEAISEKMVAIRGNPWSERLETYIKDRIDNQSHWYSKKAQHNKRLAKRWFIVSILLHSSAILLLLYRIKEPASLLPIEVIATAASAVLTWVQAKKHNELNSSYSLAAHEIVLIKGESISIKEESHLSEFIINSESAFSREHIQWTARKIV
jgi:SMODS and SLOG-associating 2TM effector domain 3/SMODS and SLOG-associating 2TM effector domain 1